MEPGALCYLLFSGDNSSKKDCLWVWKRPIIFRVGFGKPPVWDVPTRPTKQQVNRNRQGRELFGSCDFSGPGINLFPHSWFPECKSPPDSKATLMNWGIEEIVKLAAKCLAFPTPWVSSRRPISCTSLLSIDNIPEWHQGFSASLSKHFLVLFLLDLQDSYSAFIKTPKKEKIWGSLPVPSSLLCIQSIIQWLSFLLEENGCPVCGRILDR